MAVDERVTGSQGPIGDFLRGLARFPDTLLHGAQTGAKLGFGGPLYYKAMLGEKMSPAETEAAGLTPSSITALFRNSTTPMAGAGLGIPSKPLTMEEVLGQGPVSNTQPTPTQPSQPSVTPPADELGEPSVVEPSAEPSASELPTGQAPPASTGTAMELPGQPQLNSTLQQAQLASQFRTEIARVPQNYSTFHFALERLYPNKQLPRTNIDPAKISQAVERVMNSYSDARGQARARTFVHARATELNQKFAEATQLANQLSGGAGGTPMMANSPVYVQTLARLRTIMKDIPEGEAATFRFLMGPLVQQ